jgi:formylglycine-generating enzyme required for sulfatase activity
MYRTTTEAIRISLAEGAYQVRLEKPGFEPFETSLTISHDEERSLDVTLVARASSLPEQVSERKDTASRPSHLPPWDLPPGSPPPAIGPFDAVQAKAHQEAWAKHLGVEVEFENSIGMRFVLIPPGEFDMGVTQEERTKLTE